VIDTGTTRLERELENLVTTTQLDHGGSALFTPDARPAGRFVLNRARQRGDKCSSRVLAGPDEAGRNGTEEVQRCAVD
jgi:hypothetical protein